MIYMYLYVQKTAFWMSNFAAELFHKMVIVQSISVSEWLKNNLDHEI